jgi:3-hydroxyacyl-[acyl-carrier-protein] dehydratase
VTVPALGSRDAIEAAIPHRDPFLFVDAIVERSETRIVTEWTPRADAPFFRGHYPGRPIVPGVLICESAIQAGAILCSGDRAVADGSVPVLAKIADARFRRPVAPGETLRFEVTLDERLAAARYMTAKATCGGESVLRVQFVVTIAAVEAAGGA